jgi:hypothetical protein
MAHCLVECMNRVVTEVPTHTIDASRLLEILYLENRWDTKYVGGVALLRPGLPMVAFTFGEVTCKDMFSYMAPGAIVYDQTTNGLPLWCCYNTMSPERRRATNEWTALHQQNVRRKVDLLGITPLRFLMHSETGVLMLDVRRDANWDLGLLAGYGLTVLKSSVQYRGAACPCQCFTDMSWDDVVDRLAVHNIAWDAVVA